MKTTSFWVSGLLSGCLVFLFIFILPAKVKPQDTASSKPAKVVTIKLNVEGDEGIVSIDTTFEIATELDAESLERHIEQVSEGVENMEMDLQNVYLSVDDMDDNARQVRIARSIYHPFREVGQKNRMGNQGKSPRVFCYGLNKGFGPPMAPRCKQKREETLSDIIGDIPMRAVIKYDVKNTKNGRKYIIEVDDSYWR